MPEVVTYMINGVAAEGDAYVRAIDALPEGELDLVFTLPEKGSLALFGISGEFTVQRQLPDGSIWCLGPYISTDDAKKLVAGFLADPEDWRAGLDWWQLGLSTREGWHRIARILVIGVIVVALAWLVRRYWSH